MLYGPYGGRQEGRDSRLFTVMAGSETIAFIEVCDEGENFFTARPGMQHICGAYCREEYRGMASVRCCWIMCSKPIKVKASPISALITKP